ncbi:MAG: ABC transporter ATP-binding protein [Actinobacteria bacterium]|nr:ABC transporter ATP-binding protein [Actinomycetota bacterium]
MQPLAAEALHKRFGDREVVREVTFAIDPGEVVALVGPNGAGKTTMLSMLAGVLRPDSGRLTVGPGGLGWVPQRAAVYPKLTIRENLNLFARMERVKDRPQAVERTADRVGLADRLDDRVGQLSGGMRQRVSIGIGLIAEPEVLLLDEPSAALDPLQRTRLWDLLNGLAAQGVAIVYSSHLEAEVENHADRVVVLDSGAMLYNGPPSELGEGDFEAAFIEILLANRDDAPVVD